MKLKYIIIVSLVLAVLTMGMVSASDDCQNNNLTDTFEDTITVSSDEDVQTIADDGESVIGDEEDDSGDLIDDYDYEISLKSNYLESGYKYCSVYLPSDATGNITFNIDDEYGEVSELDRGHIYYDFNELGLGNGEHIMKITYDGDEIYRGFIFEKTFSISKIAINIPDELVLENDYDEEYHHLINVEKNLEGTIVLLIDDEEFINGDLDDLVKYDGEYYIPLNLDDLEYGPHTYSLTFTGDDVITHTGSFNVTYIFTIVYDVINYGDDQILTVRLPFDATSNITVTVSGRTFKYQSQGGDTEIPLNDLIYGKNKVTLTYGDDYYPEKTISFYFTVESSIIFDMYIMYGSGEGISLVLPSDATGDLNIYDCIVDEETWDYVPSNLRETVPLSGGIAFIDVSEWDLGRYPILAKYENGNYDVKDCEESITVAPKVEYEKSVGVGDNATLNITLPSNADGDLTVEIYEYVEYDYEELDPIITYSNQTSIQLNTETAAFYTIFVIYSDGRGTDLKHELLFKVFEDSKEWELNVDFPKEVLSTGVNSVYYNFPSGADGEFTLYIDGKRQSSCQADEFDWDNSLWFYSDDFEAGIHEWEVKFYGDSYFNNASQSGTFEISWAKVPEIVEIGGDSQYIEIGVNGVNKGTVELYLDNSKVDVINLTDGEAKYKLENLNQNQMYNYELRYLEKNLIKTGSFRVSYVINTEIEGYDEDSVVYKQFNELTVILPNEATGNVTVSTSKGTYTGVLENGVAVIDVSLLWGENTITISYLGDGVFEEKTVEKTYTVDRVEFLEIFDDGKLSGVSIYLPDDATGELVLERWGQELKTVPVEGGENVVDLTDILIGCYDISVNYENANNNYGSCYYWGYVSIEPEMTLPEEIMEGEPCNILINLPDAMESMEVYVDGLSKGTYQPADGKFNITLNDLSLGNHVITFMYNGWEYQNPLKYYDEDNYDFLPIEYNVVVVEKSALPANLNIIADNIDLGDNMTIYVTINEKATGVVIVEVTEVASGIIIPGSENDLYNKTFNIEIIDGRGNKTISGLTNAKYNIVAKYDGNQYVSADETAASFNVLDDPDLNAVFDNIAEGQNFTANVTMKYRGNDFITVEVTITPAPFALPNILMGNGEGKLNVENLAVGSYTLKLTFAGNDYFKADEFTGYFNVTPNYEDPEINVTAKDIHDGENATVTVNINEYATGKIIVSVNSITITANAQGSIIPKGQYNFTFENLPVGIHEVTVNFTGTPLNIAGNASTIRYFKAVVETAEMEVKPIPVSAELKVNAEDIYEGQNATINVIINESITGNVTVNINGENRKIQITKGRGNFTIPDLTIGFKEYEVKFEGDKYFLAENKKVNFTVKAKEDAGLVVSVSDAVVYIGDNVTVTLIISNLITGEVTINNEVIRIVDGKGNYTFANPGVGNYSYTVDFKGDVRFNPDSKDVSFKVILKDAGLTVNAADVFVDDDAVINININENITGKVTINVDGEEKVINIVEGVGKFTLSNLTIDEYSYDVAFEGDAQFASDKKTATFKIKPHNARIEVVNDVNEYKNGNFTFRVVDIDNNAPMANVSVNISTVGMVKNVISGVTDSEGIVSFKTLDLKRTTMDALFYPLNVGKHLFEVSIPDEKINATALETNLTITPAHIKITIDDYEEPCGSEKNVTFTASNVNGEVLPYETFKLKMPQITSEDIYVSVDENGTGSISVKLLTRGTYEMTLSNNNTVDICNVSVSKNITITAMDAQFTADAKDIKYGENATVTVSINKKFQGFVSIYVNGEEKWINVTDGEGTYIFTDLGVNTYSFTVGFKADTRFVNENRTVSFNVTQRAPELAIEDIPIIKKGNDVTVFINAFNKFSGEVKVQVGTINTTAQMKNGKANVTVSTEQFPLGEVNVTVISEANANFTGGKISAGFNITAKSDAGSNVNIPQKVTGDSFDVVLPQDATGGIYVTIDGNTTYIPLVNGSAKVDLSNLSLGSHNVTVKYDGDGNYSGFVKTTSVTLTVPVKIIAKDLTVQYSDGSKYSVTVYGEDGNLAANVEVVFKVNGKKVATAKTNAKGVATLKITQTPKTYKITVEALGVNVTKKLTVKQILTLKKVKVKKSAKKLVLKATLKKVKGKYLKGKKITFKFNGKKYTAKTNKKGVAKVTIKKKVLKKLKKGKKVTYSATYLKNTVKKTVKVKK